MKKLLLSVTMSITGIILFSGCAPSQGYGYSSPSSTNICQYVAGANVIAKDGKYLGYIGGKYSSNSIFNQYGTYGSKYSSNSIWNEYGTYGSKYSINSPFNKYSSSPPKLYKNGRAIAYLTVNNYLSNSVSPYYLMSCTYY